MDHCSAVVVPRSLGSIISHVTIINLHYVMELRELGGKLVTRAGACRCLEQLGS